ncbi:hypothetical protein [Lentzea aerocolonigenes]|uniref:hypothetical protein n=1 Tax=Lentzea aerocolonigenes TaxID=68170 RepID=UPI0012DE1FF3|nr:hypothetical protein [Lentzea aerocolonigenes]
MSRNRMLALAFAAAAALGLLAPAVAGAAEEKSAAPLACTVNPDPGFVLFYQHSDCQGRYQGWARCGWHDFTGVLRRNASSYWDNQFGGAYTLVYEGSTQVYRTWPQTGVRNVATWENDRNERAYLVC